MIPVEKMKRHTLYMGYYKREFQKELYFFKYMGDRDKEYFQFKMYGRIEVNHLPKETITSESYVQYSDIMPYKNFEFFEITFEDLATHVIVEVI